MSICISQLPFEVIYHEVKDDAQPSLPPNSQDLIASCLKMHWVNDIPGFLTDVHTSLKPDGCFLAALVGGESLQELRSSLVLAEMERLGGVASHMSPLTRVRDCGDLLQRAGFALLTVDQETLNVRYPDMFTLIEHLQGMGETHAPMKPSHLSRDALLAANSIYKELYTDEEGLLNCTIQVDIYVYIYRYYTLHML